jgi:uracil-DNA glycosylase
MSVQSLAGTSRAALGGSSRRSVRTARVLSRGWRTVPSVDNHERREALKAAYLEARACTRCLQLAENRTQVVFGAGNADADLMFVGEAPGRTEDETGRPFVGAAGKLLDELLREIGLRREDAFITNVLRCRPPGNRDPHPSEIERCRLWLLRTIELVEPKVVCALGGFATKLLRGDPLGITRVHGRPEVRVLGPRAVRLLPLFHPAAALYTPSNVEVLRADMAQLPALLALPAPEQPPPPAPAPEPVAAAAVPEPAPAPVPQLGLF